VFDYTSNFQSFMVVAPTETINTFPPLCEEKVVEASCVEVNMAARKQPTLLIYNYDKKATILPSLLFKDKKTAAI